MSDKITFDKFRQLCLMGRLDLANEYIKNKKIKNVNTYHSEIIKKIKKRFFNSYRFKAKNKKSINYLIECYENYWHQSLLNYSFHKKFEKELKKNIRLWIEKNSNLKLMNNANIYIKLKNILKNKGYHCI